jgi:hypothetical protein
LHRPASIAARTTSSRRRPAASCSAAQPASSCLAPRTVSPVTLRALRFRSTYCNARASPITGRQAARACGHGSRNGTARGAGPEAGRGAGIIALRPSDTKHLEAVTGQHAIAMAVLDPLMSAISDTLDTM